MMCAHARLDLHVHSKYSFDSLMSLKTIIKVAIKKNLNGLAITDHDTIVGGQKARQLNKEQLLVIVGSEIITDIGDIIGLFLTENIKSRDSHEVLDQIKEQDGISVFPHPFRGHKLTGKKTIEILERVDCIEVLSSRAPIGLNECRYLKSFNRALVAGSDAHFPVEIGLCQTLLDINTTDLESVRKGILSFKTISVGTYGPSYLQTMSQIIKSLKLKRIRPIIPQTFSLIKEFGKR